MAKTGRTVNESNRSLSRYLEEIGDFEPLNPDREVELAIKIKKDDHSALEELVKANLRFVVSVAKDYQGQGLPLTDLINEGCAHLAFVSRLPQVKFFYDPPKRQFNTNFLLVFF